MARPDAVFIYIGTYPSEAGARADYDLVKGLHAAGAVGTYDAAVVTKDDAGKVHVNKDEMATRHGAWGGAALIATTAVGAAAGGVGGHLWRGMSRADVRELGEIIDDGQAAAPAGGRLFARRLKHRHPGGHMTSADRPGTRSRLLLPAAVLVLAGLAAGCSSSKPAYCTSADQLKTSVDNLRNVNVVENGLGSLLTALSKVQANAETFATDAKSAFPSQTTALKNSLSSLETAVKSAQGQPPLTAAKTVLSSVAQVKTAVSNLQNAVSSNCQ